MSASIGIVHRGLLVALVASCRPGPESAPERTVPQPSTPAVVAPAEPLSALERARTNVTGHMDEYVSRTVHVQSALIAGRLREAQGSARWIADHRPDSVLEPWMPYVLRMRAAAGQIAAAADLAAAARAAGDLARTCGECHQGLEARPTFPEVAAPPMGDDDETRMQRHRWAVDRMLEGVLGPSDAAWSAGTASFPELPECEEDFGGEQDAQEVGRIRDQARVLAKQAGSASEHAERSRIYGEMLATCGTCHLSGC